MLEIIFPGNTNSLGTAFGGHILSLMDKAAAFAAGRYSLTPVVTASIDKIDFRVPIKNGDALETPLAGRELPVPIAALAPFKDRLTLLQGLSGRSSEGGSGGHSTNQGALGCYPGSAGPMAQTIDVALGEASPGIIRHVGLGVLAKPEQTLNHFISCAGPGKSAPLQCAPDRQESNRSPCERD